MLAIWTHILRSHATYARCQFCHKGPESLSHKHTIIAAADSNDFNDVKIEPSDKANNEDGIFLGPVYCFCDGVVLSGWYLPYGDALVSQVEHASHKLNAFMYFNLTLWRRTGKKRYGICTLGK